MLAAAVEHGGLQPYPPRGDLVSVARVIGSIERLDVLPEALQVGDFIQQPAPLAAVRVLRPPRFMGLSDMWRIQGASRTIGESVLYRRRDRCIPVVRGVPLTDRLELVLIARQARFERGREGGLWAPGGVA